MNKAYGPLAEPADLESSLLPATVLDALPTGVLAGR